MDYRDLILTPIYATVIVLTALLLRSVWVREETVKRYFLPALMVKLAGAISAALIYDFYYGGGDTFTFYQGVQVIWDSFLESPFMAFKLLLTSAGNYEPATLKYTQLIWVFRDPASFLVVKTAAFLGFFCFNSYLVISILFATISFIATWNLFSVLNKIYPELHKQMAIAILFVPSVFFWGSGLFKDTLTFAGFAWVISGVLNVFILKRRIPLSVIMMVLSSYFIITIKAYILINFIPPLFLLLFTHYKQYIPSQFVQKVTTPIILVIASLTSYFIVQQFSSVFDRYAISNFTDTASSMQRWHLYVAEHSQSSSGYTLGQVEPSLLGILSKFPAAVNVTLFRPYLWEVRNPVMLMAALESLLFLGFTTYLLMRGKVVHFFKLIYKDPVVFSFMLFSITFAFAVGFSSYNFGALVRYKIPCMPLYASSLFIIYDKLKRANA